MEEQVEVLRALWQGGMVEHHGEFYDFDPVNISPVPAEPVPVLSEPAWTPDSAVDGWHARHTPAWSIRADEHDVYEPEPVPVPVEGDDMGGDGDDAVHEFVRAPDPETRPTAAPPVTMPRPDPVPAPVVADAHAALEARILLPGRKDR